MFSGVLKKNKDLSIQLVRSTVVFLQGSEKGNNLKISVYGKFRKAFSLFFILMSRNQKFNLFLEGCDQRGICTRWDSDGVVFYVPKLGGM